MESTWERRDLPVLHAVAAVLDPSPGTGLQMQTIIEDSGLPEEQVIAALVALLSGRYIEGEMLRGFGGHVRQVLVSAVTERGRRAVGLWPSDDALTALVAALQEAAEETGDSEERSSAAARQCGGTSARYGPVGRIVSVSSAAICA